MNGRARDLVNEREPLGAGTPKDIPSGLVCISALGLLRSHCHCLLRVTTHTGKEALFNRKEKSPRGCFLILHSGF